MGTVQKFVVGALAVAFVTTLVLPGRQTTSVLGGTERLVTGTLSTSMGTSQGSVG